MAKNKKGLTPSEIEQLFKEKTEGNESARTKLIEENLGLTRFFAFKYQNTGYDFDDLFQIGTMGLIRAVDKFDIDRGTHAFSSYISIAIENEILGYLRKNNKHKNNLSLSAPIGHNKDGDEMTIEDIVGTDEEELFNEIISGLKIDIVKDALKSLTHREQQIILLRYGLDEAHRKNQAEVAQIFDCSQSLIARQEQKALIKMRHPKNTRKLKDFIDD